MKDHQTEAHEQVRCNLCCQSMQQYQLEHHKNNFCATHSAPPSSCSLAPSSSSAWKDISPRGKKREHPLTSKTLLKPPKNKKVVGIHSPTRSKLSISPQVLKDTQSYSMLGTCAHCNTTLPLPAHQKHQIKCPNFVSLKNVKMNQKPRSGKKAKNGVFFRFVELSLERTSRAHQVQCSCSVGIPRRVYPGPCPDSFEKLTRGETPLPFCESYFPETYPKNP
ncbi:XIAP-associated factor 1 isoform X2 [Coturnix japonica]|nr:XIAP-associated factor 1 isoform X2 [Coturnix japonica]XP_032304364.1 XIAP-associated factor 1 isoform X2 [Coturnix japonica]